MTDEPRDEQLEALYRRAAREQPSPQSDRRILEAARRAVAHPLARFAPFGGHWPLAVSAAAVVVASATLVIYLVDLPGPYLDESEVAEPRRPSAAAERLGGEMAPAQPVAPRPPAAPPASTVAPSAPRAKTFQGAPAGDALAPQVERRRLLSAPPPERAGEAAAMGEAMDGAREEGMGLGAGVASPAPADELAAIRRLLAAGDRDGARRLLADFVDRHPDHPLPAELEALLPE